MTTSDTRSAPSRRLERFRHLAIAALAVACAPQAIGGQAAPAAPKKTESSWKLPRTADGQPDLQGIWYYGTEMPLQRPEELKGKTSLTPEEAAKYRETMAARRRERGSGKPSRYSGEVFDDVLLKADWSKSTSLITDPPDGKIPEATPLAMKRRAERTAAFDRGEAPEDFGLADRCIMGWSTGPPIIPGNQSNVLQLFQSRDHFVIHTEMIHDARIVPLGNLPAPPTTITEYSGISRGHWEKDTLVIETTNFKPEGVATLTFRQWGGTDENMHLIERFTRTDADWLLYQFTVTDPTTWTKPWSASVPMHKSNEGVYEYACHEGNHSMETWLENARAKEKSPSSEAAPRRRR
jgi:hypothetical protein